MTGDQKMIEAQSFIKWLQTMAEEVETHRGELYYEGAAKAYRVIIEIMRTGVFDAERIKDKLGA